MTTLPTPTTLTFRPDSAKVMQPLARIGRIYLDTHYCQVPLTAAEVQAHQQKLRELDGACREGGRE